MQAKPTRSATRGAKRGVAVLISLLIGAFTLGACADRDTAAFNSGVPTMRSNMTVVSVGDRGPYLEAKLMLGEQALEAYSAPSEICRAVFEPGSTVAHVNNGPLGLFRRDEQDCQMMGVGNLELWRNRNTRATPAGVPRAQASFRLLFEDGDLAMLRGSFPLATSIGFTGGLDLIAIVPQTEECKRPIERGVASMEFRSRGNRALTLVGQRGLCVMRGLAQPLPDSQPRATSGEGSAE